jgi:DNA-binding SARP family transcriptional activator
MPMLCFHLLGPFAVLRDEQPLTAREWCSQQTRTILKVLLVRRGRAALADMS